MKKKLSNSVNTKIKSFLIAFLFIVFTSPINAQITIEREDYTRKANVPVYGWVVDTTNITIPIEGANQIWDYSNINFFNSYSFTLDIDSNVNMPSVNLSSTGGIVQLGGVVQPRTWYEALEEDQYATIGMKTDPISASLNYYTGTPTDSIYYTGEENIYEEPLIFYQWPINFNDTWAYNLTSVAETQVTVNSYGLNFASASQVSYDSSSSVVSGYGNLLIQNPNDTGILNIEVLLIREETRIIDSVFLNGQPAPTALLNTFDMTQGIVTNTVRYKFVAKDLSSDAFYIEYENGAISFASVSNEVKTTESSVSISMLSKDDYGINIFPNPIKDYSKISIENEWFGKLTIDITNTLGEKVKSYAINKNNSKISQELNLSNLAIGTYQAIISYKDKLVVKSFVKVK